MQERTARTVGLSYIARADARQTHIMQQALLRVFINTVVSFSKSVWNALLWWQLQALSVKTDEYANS